MYLTRVLLDVLHISILVPSGIATGRTSHYQNVYLSSRKYSLTSFNLPSVTPSLCHLVKYRNLPQLVSKPRNTPEDGYYSYSKHFSVHLDQNETLSLRILCRALYPVTIAVYNLITLTPVEISMLKSTNNFTGLSSFVGTYYDLLDFTILNTEESYLVRCYPSGCSHSRYRAELEITQNHSTVNVSPFRVKQSKYDNEFQQKRLEKLYAIVISVVVIIFVCVLYVFMAYRWRRTALFPDCRDDTEINLPLRDFGAVVYPENTFIRSA